MGREGWDHPTMVAHSSSIALLQESFRRLQRAKEMREERELLRGVAGDNIPNPMYYDPAATEAGFSHPAELMNISSNSWPSPPPPPPPYHPQVALSLWPSDSSRPKPRTRPLQQQQYSTERPVLVTNQRFPATRDSHRPIVVHDHPHDDVDTSLHL